MLLPETLLSSPRNIGYNHLSANNVSQNLEHVVPISQLKAGEVGKAEGVEAKEA